MNWNLASLMLQRASGAQNKTRDLVRQRERGGSETFTEFQKVQNDL